jgi:hypothetical protein
MFSNTHYIAYIFMMLALLVNADLASMFYPIAVFGFGLV